MRLLLSLILISLPVLAQRSDGSIAGQVLDSTGAPVGNAVLTVRGSAGQADIVVTTSADGRFSVSSLAPGDYEIEVTSPGGLQHASVKLEEHETARVILTRGTVTRFAAAPNGLPLDGRSYLDVLRETASVAGDRMALHSFGMRAQENSFVLDGLDVNDAWARGPIILVPPEAIAITTIVDGYVSVAFGHLAGAAIVARTASGSDLFHGSAFENFRNSALDARNFFDGNQRPASRWNRFGGTLGGPIQKDKWFFFGALEWLRSQNGQTVLSTVPTDQQRGGNFGANPIYDPLTIAPIGFNIFARQAFAGNRILPGRIPDAVQKLVALYPNANLPGFADNYRYAASSANNGSFANIRTDKTLSEKQTLFVRLNYQGGRNQSPSAFPNSAGNDPEQNANDTNTNTKAWAGAVSLTSVLRANLTNQLRAGYSSINQNTQANDNGPAIDITGFTSLGAGTAAPFHIRAANYELNDTLSWTTPHHAWKFGFQAIRRIADGNASDVSSRGNYIFTPDYTSYPGSANATGDAFASFLLGFPSEVRRDVQLSDYALRAWEWSGFAQDQFRFKRLTVEAGLRYSLLPPVNDANGRSVNFNFSKTAPALAAPGGNGGLSENKLAFAPRIGLALKLTNDGSTVLRGGFSKNFDTGTYLTMGSLARNAPYAAQFDEINGTFQLGPNISGGLPAASSSTLLNSTTAVNAIQSEKFTPYADEWDLFLQHRLRNGLLLEVGGLGSMGIHLYAAYDANQPYPAPTPYATPRYPFEPFHGRVNYLNLGGGSTYYAGQARVAGRVVRDLLVQFTYAFGKSLDDAMTPGTISASRPAGPQYIYDPRGNRGPSTFDVSQRAVISASYTFHKWTASTLVTLQTGFPFTPELATNSLNNGGYQLPDRIQNGSLPAGQRSVQNWFNSTPGSAFVMPALYQYGNSGFGILRGPGLANADASVARVFVLKDQLKLYAGAEGLNVLNHANLALPNRIIGVESSGTIDHTATPARTFELVVKLFW